MRYFMKKMILMFSLLAFSGLYCVGPSVITEAKVKMDISKAKLDKIILLIKQASQSGANDIESKKKILVLIALRREEADQYKKYQEEYDSLVSQKTT